MPTSLHEALSDLNSCCPYVDCYGWKITTIEWTFDDERSFWVFRFHPDPNTSLCDGFCDTLEKAIDWLSNYYIVTKKRWTIAREVLTIVLIPDVVEFVLEDYVLDSIKMK
jgi:hypothetical protein